MLVPIKFENVSIEVEVEVGIGDVPTAMKEIEYAFKEEGNITVESFKRLCEARIMGIRISGLSTAARPNNENSPATNASGNVSTARQAPQSSHPVDSGGRGRVDVHSMASGVLSPVQRIAPTGEIALEDYVIQAYCLRGRYLKSVGIKELQHYRPHLLPCDIQMLDQYLATLPPEPEKPIQTNLL